MTRPAQKTVKLRGNNLSATAKAMKFEILSINGTQLAEPKTEWFPFSQIISSLTDPKDLDKDEILVTEWIAKAKELV